MRIFVFSTLFFNFKTNNLLIFSVSIDTKNANIYIDGDGVESEDENEMMSKNRDPF